MSEQTELIIVVCVVVGACVVVLASAVVAFVSIYQREKARQDRECANCADMQRAVTQMARENRSLEKRLNELLAAAALSTADRPERP